MVSIDRPLLFAGILWFGGMAGFFWSFSVVVMPGLGLAEPTTAVAAMQHINLGVSNSIFAIGFFGAAVIATALAVRSLLAPRSAGVANGLAALIYLVGVLGVTVLGNVPMNKGLAVLDPASDGAGAAMFKYLRDWTSLNHIRTVSALLAAAVLIWSLGHARRAEG